MSTPSMPQPASASLLERPLVVGLIAGLASALSLAAAGGSPLGLLLIYLAPLPLYAAGHGWQGAAPIGAIIGTGTLLALSGPVGALTYLILVAAAPVFLTGKASLARDLPGPDGTTVTDWYPTIHLVGWLVGLAALLFLLVNLAFEGRPGGLEGAVRALLMPYEASFAAIAGELSGVGIDIQPNTLFDLLVRAVPATAALFWVMVHGASFLAGLALARRSGRAVRPEINVTRIEVPGTISLFLAGSLALAMMPGQIGFMGATLTVIFAAPLMIAGIMTIHVLSERWALRIAAGGSGSLATGAVLRLVFLVLFYLLLFQGPMALGATVIGLLDQAFQFRRNAPLTPSQGA